MKGEKNLFKKQFFSLNRFQGLSSLDTQNCFKASVYFKVDKKQIYLFFQGLCWCSQSSKRSECQDGQILCSRTAKPRGTGERKRKMSTQFWDFKGQKRISLMRPCDVSQSRKIKLCRFCFQMPFRRGSEEKQNHAQILTFYTTKS